MTKEEAIAKAETHWWLTSTPEEIVGFQLFEEKLCMPFPEFHAAIENVLGRPVWTHEFADCKALQDELRGGATPTMTDILNKLGFMLQRTDNETQI